MTHVMACVAPPFRLYATRPRIRKRNPCQTRLLSDDHASGVRFDTTMMEVS
jgi:hypothetical protein